MFLGYIIRRLLYMVVTLWIISVLTFIIIELPPGDFVTTYINRLIQSGRGPADREAYAAQLRRLYGLDQPEFMRYLRWIERMFFYGDFGQSLAWNRPVKDLILERLPITLSIAILSVIFIYLVSIPIGIYSATHQYSIGDFFFSGISFLGMSVPQFLLALILMFLAYKYFNLNIGSVFSPKYATAPWSIGKFLDMVKHLWIPIVIVAISSTASVIRVLRGCLLDELRKQYVITARAKGVPEKKLLWKYPVRIALNPVVSTIGWDIPWVISSESIVGIVLNLPTLGPLLLQSLMSQDMYLGGTIVLLLAGMTVFGTFISDILLALLDPRIRYG
jgi:peptide/nickel transport system permease protein